MTIYLDLSTPEKFEKFEKVYQKHLEKHLQEKTEELDIMEVVKELKEE